MLASLATLLGAALWRLVALFEVGLGETGWFWLVFESGLLFFVFVVSSVFFTLLGVALVHRGPTKRVHCALSGGAVGALAGIFLETIGIAEIQLSGVLNSLLAGIVALFLSGIVGGYVGYAGWFPPASIDK